MRPRFALFVALAALVAAPLAALAQQQPVRVVATGGRIGTTFYTPAAVNTAFRQRTPHKLGGPVAEIQVGFMDWIYPYGAEETNGVNAVTLDRVWLERASTGQIVPLTFSGSRTLVLPMSSTTSHWLSDPVPSSAWTGAAPARDEVFWLHVHGSIPTGGRLPAGTPTTYSGARFVVYPPANDPGTFDTAGPVPAIAGATARTTGLPLIFLGRYTGPGHLAVIGIGDSILDGTGDISNPVPVVAGFGFFNRAAVDANGANAIATFNLTRHGQAAANFVNPARQSRQTPMLQYANVVVEEYGTNDLGSAGTGDPAAIKTRTERIWAMARGAGVQKIIRTKLMPRTTSTDQWATFAGQTPNSNWGVGGARDTLNAGFDAALANGTLDGVFDTLAVIGAPADNGRWLTNGVAKYTTTDGTHVSASGNALLGAALRAELLSLTVDDTIIIDNRSPAPRYTDSGNWSSATDRPGYIGADFHRDGTVHDGSRQALFAPDVPAAGTYSVELWWPSHSTHASNTSVDVIHAGGVHSTTVNQKNGGVWHPLGTFTFTPGNNQGVYIDNAGADGYVIVDAVRFTRVEATEPEPGTPFVMQSWTSAPWNALNLATSFSAGFAPDGTAVTVTFANPKTGVNVTNQAAPDATNAVASFFGFEGTGFGVGNNGLGRFETGESFTLHATHTFELQQINWYEANADETLHLRWTRNGVAQEGVFAMTGGVFVFTGVRADANTAITITNVSQGAVLNGRLRFHKITAALLD